MAIPTLPDQSVANSETIAAQTALVAAANAAFIESATILIENAITNSLFQAFPFLIANVDYNVISAYFTALDYTVSITPYPGLGWPPIYPAPGWDGSCGGWNQWGPPPSFGTPGWESWNQYIQAHPTRIQIYWGPNPSSTFNPI
jgi:hypothetical protein